MTVHLASDDPGTVKPGDKVITPSGKMLTCTASNAIYGMFKYDGTKPVESVTLRHDFIQRWCFRMPKL